MKKLFELRGDLNEKTKFLIKIIGALSFIMLWWLISEDGLNLVSKYILPSPVKVIMSVPELHFRDALIRNLIYSLKLNLIGLSEAVVFAVPIGFIIGLFPIFKVMTDRYISGFRYLPLPMLIGLFIYWFGIGDWMKIQFLSVSIFLFLLPAVVQRVNDVEIVYDQTAITLGASMWQRIKYIFIPAALPRIVTDIIILAALSWTYITIAEAVNMNGGGIGALANIAGRSSRTDKVFAVAIIIILTGFILDKVATWLDSKIYKFKYTGKGR